MEFTPILSSDPIQQSSATASPSNSLNLPAFSQIRSERNIPFSSEASEESVPVDIDNATASSQPSNTPRLLRSQVSTPVPKSVLTAFHYDGGNYLAKALSDHKGQEMVELFCKWVDTFKVINKVHILLISRLWCGLIILKRVRRKLI